MLLFQAFIAIIMLIPADIGALLNFFSFTAWLFYGAVALALLILRFKWKDVHRPFKVGTVGTLFHLLRAKSGNRVQLGTVGVRVRAT